ncbi:MAG TPA: ComEA family DNA-binding protein [Solirubrobacterales bacterium]|jgi:competence protein ComEA|nr:ComEA family DNA-binding protein [Solirubrobacterales bacterium]
MPELSRAQVVVYAAIAAALLLVGARALRAEQGTEASFASGGAAGTSAGGGGGGDFSLSGEGSDVVVDVTGAVYRPGVYRLPAGSRVDDAIARAGGAKPAAALEAVNRAARLADGQQVVVPARGPGGSVAATGVDAEDGPISLGTATLEQLDTIDGIGPVTAEDIIEFRDEHGGLASVDQLDQVSGIGPATMEALRARLQP